MIITASLIVASLLTPKPATEIEDLEFLAGSWRGELGETLVEETWLPPHKGNMTGVFRMSGETQVDLVEIMTMTETDEGVVYRLRHFNTALVPWASEAEGPMEARVVIVDSDTVRFEILTEDTGVEAIVYDVDGETLKAKLTFTDESREPFTLVFHRTK